MPERAGKIRVLVIVLAALALAVAGVSYFLTAQSLADAHNQLAAAELRHCLSDASRTDRQRALDLALIAATERHARVLTADLPLVPGTADALRDLIESEIADDQAQVAARRADLLPYVAPASCQG